jgi:hypothetical protein
MRPAAEARSRSGQRKVAGDKEQWGLFFKGRNQLRLRLQNGGKGQFLSQRIEGVSLLVKRPSARLPLKKLFSGVFVKVAPQNVKVLRVLEPYVTWGFPNLICPRTDLETWTSKG